MAIYHYAERIRELWLPPIFNITYTIMKIYNPGEPVNIHIQSFLNIIKDNNKVIYTKKGKGKLPLFRGRYIPG